MKETLKTNPKQLKKEETPQKVVIVEYEEKKIPDASNISVKKDLENEEIDDEYFGVLDDDFHDSSSMQVFDSKPSQEPQKTVTPETKKEIPGLFQDLDGFDVIDDEYEVPVRKRPPKTLPKYKVERVFPCSYCGKTFKTEGMISRHELTHIGIKNFQCDLCGMKFLYKSYVQNHLKVVHLKVKNFKCEICGFLMYSKTHYREHKKTHDPNAPRDIECGLCLKRFTKKYSLEVHMRVHVRSLHLPIFQFLIFDRFFLFLDRRSPI